MLYVRFIVLKAVAWSLGLNWALLHYVQVAQASVLRKQPGAKLKNALIVEWEAGEGGVCHCPDCSAKRAAGVKAEGEVANFLNMPGM